MSDKGDKSPLLAQLEAEDAKTTAPAATPPPLSDQGGGSLLDQLKQADAETEPNVPRGTNEVGDSIADIESHGDYGALPWKTNKATGKKYLASSATGKYQFLWDSFKNDIGKVTGINDKQAFLANPSAQDRFFQWHEANNLRPAIKELQPLNGAGYSDKQLEMLVHFKGKEGAKDWLSNGADTTTANNVSIPSYLGVPAGKSVPHSMQTAASNANPTAVNDDLTYASDVMTNMLGPQDNSQPHTVNIGGTTEKGNTAIHTYSTAPGKVEVKNTVLGGSTDKDGNLVAAVDNSPLVNGQKLTTPTTDNVGAAQNSIKAEIGANTQFINQFTNANIAELSKYPAVTGNYIPSAGGTVDVNGIVQKVTNPKGDKEALTNFSMSSVSMLEEKHKKELADIETRYPLKYQVVSAGAGADRTYREKQGEYDKAVAMADQNFSDQKSNLMGAVTNLAYLKNANEYVDKHGPNKIITDKDYLQLGLDIAKTIGAPDIDKTINYANTGRLSDAEKVYYQRIGGRALQYKTMQSAADGQDAIATALHKNNDNFERKILDANPNFRKEQVVNAISDAIYKKTNGTANPDVTPEMINDIALELKLNPKDVGNITPEDIKREPNMVQSWVGGLNDLAGNLYEAGVRHVLTPAFNHLGGADMTGHTITDEDLDKAYPAGWWDNSGIGGSILTGGPKPNASSFFGQQQIVNTDQNGTDYLHTDRNPETGKFKPNISQFLHGSANLLGNLTGFAGVSGEIAKGGQALNLINDAALAEKAGTAATVALQSYDQNMKMAREVIPGDEADDKGKQFTMGLLYTGLDIAAIEMFSPLDMKNKIFGGDNPAGNEIMKILQKEGVEGLQYNGTGAKLMTKAIKESVTDWSKLTGGMTAAEAGKKIVDYAIAPEKFKNENVADDIKQTFIQNAIMNVIPSVAAGVGHANRDGDLHNMLPYEVGSNSRTYLDAVDRLVDQGKMDQATADQKKMTINALTDMVNATPIESLETGNKLNQDQRSKYTSSLYNEHVANLQKSTAKDKVVAGQLESYIKKEQGIRTEIMKEVDKGVPAAQPTQGIKATDNENSSEKVSTGQEAGSEKVSATEGRQNDKGQQEVLAQPEAGAVEQSGTSVPAKEDTPEQQAAQDNITVSDLMDKTITFKGKKADLYKDGNAIVARPKDGSPEWEIGRADEIGDHPASEYGLGQVNNVVAVNDKGNVVVRGKEYENRYSDPLKAINYNAEGERTSVTLHTADGRPRTFKGDVADDIAYQIHLKEIDKNNERADFENFINDTPDIRADIETARSENEQQGPSETTVDNGRPGTPESSGKTEGDATVAESQKEEKTAIDSKESAAEPAPESKVYTLADTEGISEGTPFAKKGAKVNDPTLVTSQFTKGDKLSFYAERERSGEWNGTHIVDEKGQPWGVLGILADKDGWIKKTGEAPKAEPKPAIPAAPVARKAVARKTKPTGPDLFSPTPEKKKVNARFDFEDEPSHQVETAAPPVETAAPPATAQPAPVTEPTANNSQPANEHPFFTAPKSEAEVVESAKVGDNIKAKFNDAEKIVGNRTVRTLENGEKIQGHYVMIDAKGPTASNDPHSMKMSEGFPTLEDGRNPNDRDYTQQSNEANVRRRANDYDSRALQNVPTVDKNGVVIDGNDRTMSGQLAAEGGRDGKYYQTLKERAADYGFTPDQVVDMKARNKNPRVIFVPDRVEPYTTETFAKFNPKTVGKVKTAIEDAIHLGRTVPQKLIDAIGRQMEGHERVALFFADKNAVKNVIDLLEANNIINSDNKNAYYNPKERTFTAEGKELLQNMMLGKTFNEDNLRLLQNHPDMREKMLFAMNNIMAIEAKGEKYSLKQHISDALHLWDKVENYRENVANLPATEEGREKAYDQYMSQQSLFGETISPEAEIIWDDMNDRRKSSLRELTKSYLHAANEHGNGVDIFGSESPKREELLNQYAKNKEHEKQLLDLARKSAGEGNERPAAESLQQTENETTQGASGAKERESTKPPTEGAGPGETPEGLALFEPAVSLNETENNTRRVTSIVEPDADAPPAGEEAAADKVPTKADIPELQKKKYSTLNEAEKHVLYQHDIEQKDKYDELIQTKQTRLNDLRSQREALESLNKTNTDEFRELTRKISGNERTLSDAKQQRSIANDGIKRYERKRASDILSDAIDKHLGDNMVYSSPLGFLPHTVKTLGKLVAKGLEAGWNLRHAIRRAIADHKAADPAFKKLMEEHPDNENITSNWLHSQTVGTVGDHEVSVPEIGSAKNKQLADAIISEIKDPANELSLKQATDEIYSNPNIKDYTKQRLIDYISHYTINEDRLIYDRSNPRFLDDIKDEAPKELRNFSSFDTIEDIFGEGPEGDQAYVTDKLHLMLNDAEKKISVAQYHWGDKITEYGPKLLEHINGMSGDDGPQKGALLATYLGKLREAKLKGEGEIGTINNLMAQADATWQKFINGVGKNLNTARILRLFRDKNLGEFYADRILLDSQRREKQRLERTLSEEKISDDVAEQGVLRDQAEVIREETERSAEREKSESVPEKKPEPPKQVDKKFADKAEAKLKEIKDPQQLMKDIIEKIKKTPC